jgi:hypothetical protein
MAILKTYRKLVDTRHQRRYTAVEYYLIWLHRKPWNTELIVLYEHKYHRCLVCIQYMDTYGYVCLRHT